MALPAGSLADIDHDGGDLTEWTTLTQTGSTLSASTDQAHEGTYSMKYVQDGGSNTDGHGRVTFTAPSDGDTVYFFFAFYIAASQLQNSTNWRLSRLRNTTLGNRFALNFQTNASGEVFEIDSQGHATNYGGNYLNVSTSINTGEWNTFQMAYKVSATVGGWEMWMNGVSLGNSGYTRNTSGAIGDLNSFQVGSDSTTGGPITTGGVFYIDSVKVSDTYIEEASTSSVMSAFAAMV